MSLGVNRAELFNKSIYNEASKNQNKPCIFLSHRSLDKKMVKEIGDYIMKAGIDIYLDIYDEELQNAENDKKITACIQKGIEKSTHVMCLLSPNTVGSWWVPYEIGYGEKANKKISSLKLKDLPLTNIPSYIKITRCLNSINDLNNYLSEIAKEYGITLLQKSYSFEDYKKYQYIPTILESLYNHPLSNYIDKY